MNDVFASEFMPPIVATLVLDAMGFAKGLDESIARAESTKAKFLAASKGMAAGFLMVGGAVAAASVSAAAAWDNAMLRLRTQAGASTKEVEKMSSAVLKLAPQVGQSPNALAQALYFIESAGYRGSKALDMLTQSAKAAAIGGSNLTDTTKAVVSIMQSGIGGVGSMTDAVALMNTTVGLGDLKMEDLVQAITTGILPAGRAVGLTFQDIAAAMDVMSRSGVPPDIAMQRLRMTIGLMEAPSKAAAKELASIGLSSTAMANDMRKPNGLVAALQDLQNHLTASGKTATEQSQIVLSSFGRAKSGATMEQLLQQLPELTHITAQYGTTASRTKKFQEAWAEQNKEFEQRINDLKASLEVLEISIGNKLIPLIEKIITGTISVIHWFERHRLAAEALKGALMGGLVVALSMVTAGFIAWAVAMAANPIFQILIAVEALAAGIYLLYKNWNHIWSWMGEHKLYAAIAAGILFLLMPLAAIAVGVAMLATHWQQAWTLIGTVFGEIAAGILVGFKATVDGMFSMVEGILQAGSHLPFVGHYFKTAKNSVEDMRQGFDNSIEGSINDIHNFISNLSKIPAVKRVTFTSDGVPNVVADVTRINTALEQIGSSYVVSVGGTGRKLIPGAATGMLVPGNGSPTADDKLVRVSSGEAIVPAHLVGAIAPFLAAHGVPGFAAGGLISNTTVKVDTMGIGNSLFSGYGGIFAGGSAAGATSSNANVALGAQLAASLYGWVGPMFEALNKLWTRESGWNADAVNPTSGAAGIAQSLGHGPVPLGDAYAQILWGLSYIAQRYGNPINAWAHEVSSGWYDRGGWLQPGWTMAYNGTGHPERIRTAEQEAALGGLTINLYAHVVDRNSVYALADLVLTGISRKKARGDRLPQNLSI